MLNYSGAGIVFRGAGWVFRKVGLGGANPIQAGYQFLSDRMGDAAEGIAGGIAGAWNFIATVVDRTGWAVWHTALAVDRLYMMLTAPVWLAKQIIRTSPFVLAFRWIREHVAQVTEVTNVISQPVAKVAASPVGAAIRVIVRPDRVAVAKLREWTVAKVKALEAAIAHTGTIALPLPHSPVGDLKDLLNRLRRRVARIERGALPYIASGVFVATLARFGLGWLRCSNVKTMGRGVCRMDEGALYDLLASTTVITSSISIGALARELSEGMDVATSAVRTFVRE